MLFEAINISDIHRTNYVPEVLLTFRQDAHTVNSQIVLPLVNFDDHNFKHFCAPICFQVLVSIFVCGFSGNVFHHGVATWHDMLRIWC